MLNAKETVKALLDRLPDDCSLDDVAQGRVIPHDEVAESLRSRWGLHS